MSKIIRKYIIFWKHVDNTSLVMKMPCGEDIKIVAVAYLDLFISPLLRS